MSDHRTSYWKTTLLAGASGFAGVAIVGAFSLLPGASGMLLVIGALTVGLPMLLVAAGGLLVLYRDSRAAAGRPDLLLSLNAARGELRLATGALDAGLAMRHRLRRLLGIRQLAVGEWVRIRSLDEIRATLTQGELNALPFMPEMERFCGQTAQVFRRLDKVYDFGGAKNLRRLRGVVLLRGLRCDGSAHGGCQARCALLWHDAWLEPVGRPARDLPTVPPIVPVSGAPASTAQSSADAVWRCQFTRLVAASTPLAPFDPRQDLWPLLAGNITLRAFGVVHLTRLFNAAQRLRRGTGFPRPLVAGPSTAAMAPTMVPTTALQPGTWVRVRPAGEIAATLDARNKNRGLWFDPDMLKHCGQRYRFAREVHRIIDDTSGRMREMKTPCLVLEGALFSGEFLRLSAQEEDLFWRAAWLAPESSESQSPTA